VPGSGVPGLSHRDQRSRNRVCAPMDLRAGRSMWPGPWHSGCATRSLSAMPMQWACAGRMSR